MKKYIVDTNILMSIESLADLIKNKSDGRITIPVYVIEELDNLKTKEATRGFQARRALRNIEASKGDLDFYLPRQHDAWYIPDSWDKDKVDNKIINYAVIENLSQEGMVVVLSNDLNVRLKCEAIGIKADTYFKAVKTYPGWTEVRMDFNHFVDFEEGRRNKWGIPVGQYLIIRDEEGHEIHGIYKYLGDKDWDQVMPQKLGNIAMGTISPKDAYQQCAINSLVEDDFTVITGQAGTGKTLLSLTYCLREISTTKRDKLIIFANPVKARGSEELGFYKGDRTEKLLQNSIGAMLSSKLGGQDGVDMLMEDGKVEILPVSDIRGFEVGPKQIMYITEAQNLSVDLLKLAIQRCADGAKIILEGDPFTQVDHYAFEGDNNGLKRVIEVFEGELGFSHIQLPNIYRSKIADKAEEM